MPSLTISWKHSHNRIPGCHPRLRPRFHYDRYSLAVTELQLDVSICFMNIHTFINGAVIGRDI